MNQALPGEDGEHRDQRAGETNAELPPEGSPIGEGDDVDEGERAVAVEGAAFFLERALMIAEAIQVRAGQTGFAIGVRGGQGITEKLGGESGLNVEGFLKGDQFLHEMIGAGAKFLDSGLDAGEVGVVFPAGFLGGASFQAFVDAADVLAGASMQPGGGAQRRVDLKVGAGFQKSGDELKAMVGGLRGVKGLEELRLADVVAGVVSTEVVKRAHEGADFGHALPGVKQESADQATDAFVEVDDRGGHGIGLRAAQHSEFLIPGGGEFAQRAVNLPHDGAKLLLPRGARGVGRLPVRVGV